METSAAELFMIVAYANIHALPVVSMRGQGQKEGGGFWRFILSFGAQEGAARLIEKGATRVAGGTVKEVVKKGVTSFVAGLLTRLGLTALASTVAPVVGTVIAVAVQAAVWLGGFIVQPLWNLATKFFRGEIGPWGRWTQAFGGYVRGALGAVGETARQWYDNPMIMLPVIIIVIILLPVLPLGFLLSPTLQDTTRTAALLTSYNTAIGGGPFVDDFEYFGPFPDQNSDIIGCPTTGGVTQGPFGGDSHGNVDAYDFGAEWGAPVYATHDGIVAQVIDGIPANTYCGPGSSCSFGNFVRLVGKSPDGTYYTIYAHLLSTAVTEGQTVEAGKTIIGYVDATGYTFKADGTPGGGTHLHYQYNGPGRLQLPAGCGS